MRTAFAMGLLAALYGCGGGGGGDESVAALQHARYESPAAAGSGSAEPRMAGQTSVVLAASITPTAAATSAALAPWRFAAQPEDTRVAPGDAASFHVRADGGNGAFEYQWLRDGEPIEGANASQYSFVTTLDDGGATFAVRVRPRGAGAGHERESAPATVSWRDPAT